MIATVGWALVFAIRAGVQALLYGEDHPGLLAVGRPLLGWLLVFCPPVTAAGRSVVGPTQDTDAGLSFDGSASVFERVRLRSQPTPGFRNGSPTGCPRPRCARLR
jgi:hypothetical protein